MRYLRGFQWQRVVFSLSATILVAACDNPSGVNGIAELDIQDLDIDFDTLDVDVQGMDIAGYLDVLKQDTIGGPDVAPDVDAGGGTDTQATDVQTADLQTEDVQSPDVDLADTATADVQEPDIEAPDTQEPDVQQPDVPPPPECTVDGDCADADACTLDTCDVGPGKCVHTDVSAACADGNPCTSDGCDPASGCAYLPNDATCTDNDACTVGEACAEGACAGGEKVACDDGLQCTLDTCDVALGCTATAVTDDTGCEDGNACTAGDSCIGGACQAGAVIDCMADDNVCTAEVCDPTIGCTSIPNSEACDDGDACTLGDTCGGGACLPGSVTDCTDGNACTVDTCAPALGCANDVTITCDDANACTTDACEPAIGCTATALEVGAGCDDQNACTESDSCGEGAVCAGLDVTCVDENVCTSDQCDPATGCVNLPIAATCSDGNPCTTGDACEGVYCVGGYIDPCDDQNPCTADSCGSGTIGGEGPAPSGCVNLPLLESSCDDGNPCTTYDYCYGSVCTAGSGPVCDDGNACTTDSCDEVTNNICTHAADPGATECSDGSTCTLGDYCDVSTGACVPGPETVTCLDDDPCTSDVCNPMFGCLYNPTCDDGDPCTADYCNVGECYFSTLVLFRDDFSKGNTQGWTLDETWEIGPAKLGKAGDVAPGDPAEDHSPSKDNQVAGVVIGGLAPRVLHPMYYLTSPEIDTTKLEVPAMEFWRWLTSDYAPYAVNTVDVWDGNAWVTLWSSEGTGGTINDAAWQRQSWDISAYSNPKFRLRIGFAIGDAEVYAMGSWNVDDVVVGESGQCVQPTRPTVAAKPQPLSTARMPRIRAGK